MGEVSPPGGAEPGAGASGELGAATSGESRRASRWGIVALAAVALIAVGGVVATMIVVSGPRPDDTLHRVDAQGDAQALAILEREGAGVYDLSSLRGYESYRGIELWTVTSVLGPPCLLAIDPSAGDRGEDDETFGASCAPAPAMLFLDVGLPAGAWTRLVFRGGEAIDVFEYPPEEDG